MKKTHLLAMVATGLLLIAAMIFSAVLSESTANAQQPVRSTARSAYGGAPVALVDVNHLFQNHPGFSARMDDLKAAVENAEKWVKQERDSIRKAAENADRFRKGTPDYKAMEEQLAKRQAELAAKVQLQKRDFYDREAKVYHTIYQEIEQEVAYYAQANNIAMVLRFNGEPMDSEDPKDVLRGINKPVVYHNQQLDITPVILSQIQRRYQGAARGGAAPTNTGQRQANRPGVYWNQNQPR